MYSRIEHGKDTTSSSANDPRQAAYGEPRHKTLSVSIITVTLNSEKSISSAIESVLNQNLPDLEYVVVDGASTDRTAEIVASYRARFGGKLVFISELDDGLYDAMNKGIAMASGEIIGILNSDDRLLPGAVTAVCELFNSTGADIVYGDVIVEGTWGSRRLTGSAVGFDAAMTIPHPGCFVRARAYSKWGNFDTALRTAADYDLLLRFIQGGAVLIRVDKALCVFSEGGASSRSFSLAKEMFKIHLRHFSLWHAVKHGLVRFTLAFYLKVRRTVGIFVLGERNYASLRAKRHRPSVS